jgi:hypothetical protein
MDTGPHHYYDSFAKEIISKFQRVRSLVSHNPTNGEYHEEILKVVLKNFLSKRFSVKTGFVYKNEFEVSNQVDIMIVDEYRVSAYIYQEGDFAIVRPSAGLGAADLPHLRLPDERHRRQYEVYSRTRISSTSRSESASNPGLRNSSHLCY